MRGVLCRRPISGRRDGRDHGARVSELFAAVGIHSGLPVGAAHDVASALALMKTAQLMFTPVAGAATLTPRTVPVIVLHGDADRTVNPANADRLIQSAVQTYQLINPSSPLQTSMQTIDAADHSHAYRRTRHTAVNGTNMIEQWEIHRCGTRMVRRKSRGVVHRRARTRRYAGNASILRSTRHAFEEAAPHVIASPAVM